MNRVGLIGSTFCLLPFAFCISAAKAADWTHWRGPGQDGHVTGQNLPETFDIDKPGSGGLVWKTPVGGRSAPILLGNKLITLNARDPESASGGERVSCFDADTGKVLWEHKLNVYHADAEVSRVGWTSPTADPATGRVYVHTTAGEMLCLDSKDGSRVWSRQLGEEFGRFYGYGGRIPTPVFDNGLVICAVVNSSWGDQARGWNRFLAFDGATGNVVWISETALPNKDTYQSHPVVATIGGQRLLISGCGDGTLSAFKVRTGELVWSYRFCAKAVNSAPVVAGNLVYCAHGDENPEPGGSIGRVVCVDASKLVPNKDNPKLKQPTLVWEYKRNNRFGLSHAALADGRLYIPDDSSVLFCFNAKTGKVLWKLPYGTASRGAPLVVDNRLYVFDVNGKLTVLTLKGDEEPDEAQTHEYTFRVPKGVTGFNETHGTPIAANGRLYFTTSYDTFCVGATKPDAARPAPKPPAETPFDPAAAPVAVRIYPHEVAAKPGDTITVELKFLDANGRELPAPKDAAVTWALPTPPVPKGKTTAPPPLAGEIKGNGVKASVALAKNPGQQGLIAATAGKLTAVGRVRVVPQLPYAQDFERAPEGGSPPGWVNTTGKFVVKTFEGGKVLSKVNTDGRPPIARANGYFTGPASTNYTVECDLRGTEVGGKFPDMGVVNGRYTLVLDGKPDAESKGRTLRLATWDPRGRYSKVVPFNWDKDTWYRAKFEVRPTDKGALAKGKVWKRGEPEPADWTVQYEFAGGNQQGAAAVFGYVSNSSGEAPGSEIYYDNLRTYPNK
jgi:outer membrane protein assembly factor BamB